MISEQSDTIKKAYDELIVLSKGERKRLEYEQRMKVIRDHNSWLESATEQGLRQGIEHGLKQGRQEGNKDGLRQAINFLIKNTYNRDL